jgi:hypothetical protein
MKIVFFALAVLFAGCATQKRCSARFPPQVISDSIYIEKLKEVPVYIDGDTIIVKVPVNCPDQDIAIYENVKLRQTIRILNGKLSSITEIKGDTVKVYVPEIHEKVKEVIVTKPQKYIPTIYKGALWLWIGVLIAIGAYIAWKVFKPKIL